MKSFMQIVVPIGILMAVVGLIAYISQNTTRNPKISKPTPTTAATPNSTSGDPIVWLDEIELDPKPVIVEWRSFTHRHYFFRNPHPHAVYVALEHKSCTCSEVSASSFGLSDDDWEVLVKSPSLGRWCELVASVKFEPLRGKTNLPRFTVPPTVAGKAPRMSVLRVTWEAKKPPAESQDEGLRVLVHAQVESGSANVSEKLIGYQVVPAVAYFPFTLDFGEVLAGSDRSVHCMVWSDTRDRLQFKPKVVRNEAGDAEPCAVVGEPVELTRDQIRAAVASFPQNMSKVNPRVAYRFSVTFLERRGEHQAEMGPIQRRVYLTFETDATESAIGEEKIQLTGRIRGEVRLNNGDEKDRLALGSFRSDRGKKAIAVIAASDPKIELEEAVKTSNEKITAKLDPPMMTVEGQKHWSLHIELAPNAFLGDLPSATEVTLRTKGQPPRLLRIPITGKADR